MESPRPTVLVGSLHTSTGARAKLWLGRGTEGVHVSGAGTENERGGRGQRRRDAVAHTQSPRRHVTMGSLSSSIRSFERLRHKRGEEKASDGERGQRSTPADDPQRLGRPPTTHTGSATRRRLGSNTLPLRPTLDRRPATAERARQTADRTWRASGLRPHRRGASTSSGIASQLLAHQTFLTLRG